MAQFRASNCPRMGSIVSSPRPIRKAASSVSPSTWCCSSMPAAAWRASRSQLRRRLTRVHRVLGTVRPYRGGRDWRDPEGDHVFHCRSNCADRAIASVEAKGETALYDSLVRAASLIDQWAAQQRYVVLLSDGGDTVSSASLDKAVSRVKGADAPVYAVALSSPEYPARGQGSGAGHSGTLLSTRESESSGSSRRSPRRFRRRGSCRIVAPTQLTRSGDHAERDQRRMRRKATAIADKPSFEAAKGRPWKPVHLSPLFAVSGLGDSRARRTRRRLRRRGNRIAAQARRHRHRPTPVLRAIRATRMDPKDMREATPIAAVSGRGWGMRSHRLLGKRGFTPDFKIRLERAGYRLRPMSSCICTFSASLSSVSSFSLRCAGRSSRWRWFC